MFEDIWGYFWPSQLILQFQVGPGDGSMLP